ncbi:MAG: ABC transporter permease [Desulfobulbus sp.]|jgi:ABC-2 type transport system permease protein|uniref:ABC transporter permease n=1 Tax=Desulfobulbus sp. TaxID=895 RepID=UPI00283E8FDC|nr:ABC transporter permease [Desulfobulbus sp.]MDR2550963.1 ABC transporter permease [Desulfobulbus sp.]
MKPGPLLRLKGIVRKEWLQVVRDPSSIAIAFFLPLLLLFIFGYGVSLDATNIRMGLVIEQPDSASLSFAGGFEHSPYFAPIHLPSIQEAESALRASTVDGIVWLRQNFAADYLSKQSPPIGVLINGVDANTARLIDGYVQGIWFGWLEQQAEKAGRTLRSPVQLEQRIWFNPQVRSTDFLVPGILAVVMTLIGALLTALVIAREWERGTMESLLVTRISVNEILLGKLIPYFVLGMGGLVLSLVMAETLFHVPVRGSLWLLFAVSALFLWVALGMGFFISTVFKSQFVAALVAMVSTFLPAFILSGFIFDIQSMPAVIQGVTHLIAARYYVAILQTLFLVGDVWSVILPNAAALAAMGLFFHGLVHRRTRKRLE